ncbi:uncharacterized protein LOC110464543 [Mizuhopecten yessoensis]|uniref:uncharacterized protein LOC110464543 n=1 Tax=Mizuhopecten yessoensis TaxID=6573 RepID=UPI000B45B3E5|nr:uncharacterized protein LOC110464543 [Mizuhopecten yessoensis]
MTRLPLPSVSNTTYRTMIMRQFSQLERYIVMISLSGVIRLNGSDQVPSDWYTYVPDFNPNITYYLLGVTWSNVSGPVLDCQEAHQYRKFIFRKTEFVYRNLIMSPTTSATVSSTNSTTAVSYKATASATSPATTTEPGIPSTIAVWNSSESPYNNISFGG